MWQAIKDQIKKIPKTVELYDIWRMIIREPLNEGRRREFLTNYFRWFYFERPRGQTRIVVLQNGMRSIVHPDSDSGEANIFTVNVDYHETEFVRRLLEPGDFIVDAGCNVGNRTLALADRIGGGLLLDANPECLERLAVNFAINDIDMGRFHLVAKAVGESLGAVTFSDLGGSSTLNRIVGGDTSAPTWTVALTMIDHELEALGSPPCAYIKLDLEGHDFPGILGAQRTLNSGTVKVIRFERLPKTELNPLLTFFAEFGWVVFSLDRHGQITQEQADIRSNPDLMAMPRDRFMAVANRELPRGEK